MAGAAWAQSAGHAVDIAAQPLDKALAALARQTGVRILFSTDLTESRQAPALKGTMTPSEALERLLAGSGLVVRPTAEGGYTVAPQQPALRPAGARSDSAAQPEQTLPTVSVSAPVSDVARAGLFGNRKVQETPFGVTGFTASLMRDQQARLLGDVLTNDASVRSSAAQNGETEEFLVRGLVVLANEATFDGLYGLQQVRRSGLGHAERVEILKGPNAVINGISPFGAFGGVINIVPKRAGDEPVTDLSVDYASRRMPGARLDVGRRFGPDGAFGVRLNAAVQDGETQIKDSDDSVRALDVALDYRSGPLRATLDLGYQKDDFEASQQRFTIAPGVRVPSAPDGSRNLSQSWGRYDTGDQRFLFGVSYDLGKDWTVSARYGELRHTDDGKLPSGPRIVNANGDFTYRTIGTVALFETRTGEVGLRGRFDTGPVKHELALNSTYYYADNRFAFSVFGPTLTSNLYDPAASARPDFAANAPTHTQPGNERTFKTLAVADTLSMLDDALQLTLGLRRQSIDVTNYVNLSGNATGAISSVIDQSETSPVMAALYKLSEAWSVYANASEGLAPGPQAPGGTANVGTVLPPIEAKSYELGTKADYGRFGGSAAVFHTTQQVGITDPVTTIFGTDGEIRIRGLELTLHGSPWPSLRLVGGVTLLDAEQTKTAGGANDGNDAVGVPDKQLSLYAEWLTPFARGLSLNTRILHTGEQSVDAANTQSIPSWTRVDLGAKYVFRGATPVTLRATVENVADRAYWAAARNGLLARGGPRAVFVSAELNF